MWGLAQREILQGIWSQKVALPYERGTYPYRISRYASPPPENTLFSLFSTFVCPRVSGKRNRAISRPEAPSHDSCGTFLPARGRLFRTGGPWDEALHLSSELGTY